MSTDSQLDNAEEALTERVRQAEVHIAAQVTFLAAAYHRAAVLSGVLFAVVAALFGVAVTDWSDWLYPPLMAKVAIALTVALVLIASSTALSAVSLPGAVDNDEGDATKDGLLRALLVSYRVAAKRNARRLTVSKYLFFAAFLCMAAVVAGAGIVIRAQYLADTEARAYARDCWLELSDEEKAILRNEMRPRGGMLDRMADLIGQGGATTASGAEITPVGGKQAGGSPGQGEATGGAGQGETSRLVLVRRLEEREGEVGTGAGTGGENRRLVDTRVLSGPGGRQGQARTTIGRGDPDRCTIVDVRVFGPTDPGSISPGVTNSR